MSKFERYLTKPCCDALQHLSKASDENWWKEVLSNKNLLLAIRGGYLNAYAKGQSVFKIGPEADAGKPRVTMHYKWVNRAADNEAPQPVRIRSADIGALYARFPAQSVELLPV